MSPREEANSNKIMAKADVRWVRECAEHNAKKHHSDE